jgi:hypothetical protein
MRRSRGDPAAKAAVKAATHPDAMTRSSIIGLVHFAAFFSRARRETVACSGGRMGSIA